MSEKLIPLGVSAAVPSRGRHFSSMALVREEETILFDCGEGTQLRIAEAGLKPSRVTTICISHLHGDHYFGLPGLLSTLGLLGHPHPITVVGPEDLFESLTSLPGMDRVSESLTLHFKPLAPTFSSGVVVQHRDYKIEAATLDHGVFCVGYRYEVPSSLGSLDVEKARSLGITDHGQFRQLKSGESVVTGDGSTVRPDHVLGPPKPSRSFAFVADTRPCDGARWIARNADLLVHESTFADEHEKRAIETGHSTAVQAATVALDAGAVRLLLSHFSARYKDVGRLVDEAREVFENVDAAVELKSYLLKNQNGEFAE